MILGLEGNALARVCYHAQELSLLTATARINFEELMHVKQQLDEAFSDMLHHPKESHGPN